MPFFGVAGDEDPLPGAGPYYAVIEIGSNTVRLVIFEASERTPLTPVRMKAYCGLGAALAKTGRLSTLGCSLALAALKRFKHIISRTPGIATLDVVATAALREAADGRAFAAEIENKTGFQVRILSGEDEARYSGLGVLMGDPQADGVVADLGGASLELIGVANGATDRGMTLKLGPQHLQDFAGKALTRVIEARLRAALKLPTGDKRFGKNRPLFLVGGAWRALIRAYRAKRGCKLNVLQGFTLDREEAARMAAWGRRLSPEKLQALAQVSQARAAGMPAAAAVLAALVRRLEPSEVVLSTFGLRDGLLADRLPKDVMAADPLILACEGEERRRGRRPGRGDGVWRWLAPVFEEFDVRQIRQARAACMLSDLDMWEQDDASRALSLRLVVQGSRLSGVTHQERVFIGLAALHTLRDGAAHEKAWPGSKLLDEANRCRARALGLGIRLADRIAASTEGLLEATSLAVNGRTLTLRVTEPCKELLGDDVKRRLKALAEARKLAPEHKVVRPQA